jgi:hypothetical protein
MNNKTIKKRDPGLPRHKCKTLLKKKRGGDVAQVLEHHPIKNTINMCDMCKCVVFTYE